MYSSLASFLRSNQIEYYKNYNGARLNSFEIGGEIPIAIFPNSQKALCKVLRELFSKKYKYFLLGNGTNTYLNEGYNGIIVVTRKIQKIKTLGTFLTASCGSSLSDIAFEAMINSLTGLEFVFGIPGSVGGGAYMNAMAYDSKISDIVFKSKIYDVEKDSVFEFDKFSHNYMDKYSVFMMNKNLVLLETTFKLLYGSIDSICVNMKNNLSKRIKSQPLEYGSGGSAFKRPLNGYASKMIDECNLKGKSLNGASVSTHHAGFIINDGFATSNDVTELAKYVQNSVYSKFKIRVEKEIILVE
jgi:UDP-N-acetylmuramate dehydrogenase